MDQKKKIEFRFEQSVGGNLSEKDIDSIAQLVARLVFRGIENKQRRFEEDQQQQN